MTVTHLVGQVLDRVADIPDASIDLVATSPPFLALRNYNNLDGQWGSEATPAAFLDNLLDLVEALGPKLAGHGSIAFELGDTYSGSGGGGGDYLDGGIREGQNSFNGSARAANAEHWRQKQKAKDAWPLPKSLTGVPTLFAWSLAYGRNLLNPDHTIEPWRIRNVIVWARANPPVGALGDKYRPATSYITVATRSGKRWFDLDAVRVPHSSPSHNGQLGGRKSPRGGDWTREQASGFNPVGAPPLDHCNDTEDLTWHINTHGSSLAHYAMWPPTLAERLVLSMCPAEVCTECGEPRRRITEQTNERYAALRAEAQSATSSNAYANGVGRADLATGAGAAAAISNGVEKPEWSTVGWSDCGHNNHYRPGHVLDPFCGSGTTCCVAELHGRDSTGIDLDPANKDLMPRRMAEVKQALFGYREQKVDGQLDMFGDSL